MNLPSPLPMEGKGGGHKSLLSHPSPNLGEGQGWGQPIAAFKMVVESASPC